MKRWKWIIGAALPVAIVLMWLSLGCGGQEWVELKPLHVTPAPEDNSTVSSSWLGGHGANGKEIIITSPRELVVIVRPKSASGGYDSVWIAFRRNGIVHDKPMKYYFKRPKRYFPEGFSYVHGENGMLEFQSGAEMAEYILGKY